MAEASFLSRRDRRKRRVYACLALVLRGGERGRKEAYRYPDELLERGRRVGSYRQTDFVLY